MAIILTPKQYQIMDALLSVTTPCRARDILSKSSPEIRRGTIHTILNRLEEKELICSTRELKSGRNGYTREFTVTEFGMQIYAAHKMAVKATKERDR
jgi:predicted transcriptional regulator